MSATRLVSITVLVITALASSAVTPAAQVPVPLVPGARIRLRLRMAAQPIVGTLDSISGDTLRLRAEGESEARGVTLSTIEGIDVSRGQRSNAIKGAEVGLAVGGTVGLIGFIASCKEGFAGLPACRDTWLFAPMGGGVLLAYVVGSLGHSEKWKAVPLPTLLVAPVSLNRMGITILLRL